MSTLIIFVLLVVFLLMPVLTYVIFWYEAGNSTYGITLDRQSDGKPFRWLLRGILSSICTNVVVVCLFPLGFFKKLWLPGPPEDAEGPTVVLIHGIYHNASAWTYYRWRLRRRGYGRICVFSYGSRNTTFWQIYGDFERWMTGVERDCRGNPVVLVGHSLGGLLAKTYAGKRGGDSAIRRVITIGSPFKGSKMAVLGLGQLAASLRYQGPLVRELETILPATELPCVAFYSPVDNMALPWESMMPPKGWKQERTVPLCHTGPLYHGPTFDRVLWYMDGADSRSA